MPSPAEKSGRRFEGRRIYITGAASGIGLATAQLMAREGAQLAMVDVAGDRLREAAREIGAKALILDLTDGEAIDRSVVAAGDALGGIDGVVNCAGVGDGTQLDALDPERWRRVMAINLDAPYRVCRAALPYLNAVERSSIVNVASGEALLPSSGGAPVYAASKGGLLAMTRALAAGLAPGIRVNAVCPGVTDTPMTEQVLHGAIDPRSFLVKYALGRAADPIEIAEAIAFLASDASSYVTGITLAADGGRSFH